MKWVKLTLAAGLAAALVAAVTQAEIVIQAKAGPTNAEPEAKVVPPPGASEKSRNDLLEFLNGDVLHGAFLSIDSTKGALWQHPAVKQPVEINLASIARIKLDQLKSGTNSTATARQTCTVRLTNKDELFGELVSLDDQSLQLDTWYGGLLTIPRKMLASLAPGNGQSASVYEGPTGLEGWTARGNTIVMRPGGGMAPGGVSWTYNNGAFTSSGSGSIGRSFTFPPLVNIEFDLAWRGYLQLAISLFSDTIESYGANSYLLQLNQGSAYLQRISNVGSPPFTSADISTLARKNQAHVSIRVNKEQRTVSLLIDGTLVRQWTDQNPLPGGPHLVFHQQGQGQTKLSHIKVSAWDGKFESPDGAEKKSKEDLVKLTNSDKISGTLKNIQNGKMNFQTAFAALEVPLERITEIELAGEKSERAPQQAGDVRLTFLNRGSLSLHLQRWDGQQIIGSSPNLGQVKLNPSAFAEIQLNLDKKPTETETSDMGSPGPGDELITDHD